MATDKRFIKELAVVLNTGDMEVIQGCLESAQRKISRAHPNEKDMWIEIMDLTADLHKVWEIVWPVERLTEARKRGRESFRGN